MHKRLAIVMSAYTLYTHTRARGFRNLCYPTAVLAPGRATRGIGGEIELKREVDPRLGEDRTLARVFHVPVLPALPLVWIIVSQPRAQLDKKSG